jgi:hypothetical protein
MKNLFSFRGKSKTSYSSKVIAVLTLLHIAFIILLDKVTAFAPDENNYIDIFKNLYNSNFSLVGYPGWPEGSINPLRAIYMPAKALDIIGFSDFYSVRLLTIFYSMLSLSLLLRLSSETKFLGRTTRFWVIAAFYMPTFFLWTSIGLREGFVFLALTGTFYGIKISLQTYTFSSIFLILISTTLLLVSRIYLYVLLILAILAALLTLSYLSKKLDWRGLKILALCMIPALIFPSISTVIIISARSNVEIESGIPIPTPEALPGGQTLDELSAQLDNNSILGWVSKSTGLSEILEAKLDSYATNDLVERSRNAERLQREPANLKDPVSVVGGVFSFLILPAPFINNGSFFLNMQSYESFAWYLYYALLTFLVFGLLQRKYELNLHAIVATYFTLGFILLSALVEINDGTSVRHRSVLLLGILIMLATFREKDSKMNPSNFINPRNNP